MKLYPIDYQIILSGNEPRIDDDALVIRILAVDPGAVTGDEVEALGVGLSEERRGRHALVRINLYIRNLEMKLCPALCLYIDVVINREIAQMLEDAVESEPVVDVPGHDCASDL